MPRAGKQGRHDGSQRSAITEPVLFGSNVSEMWPGEWPRTALT